MKKVCNLSADTFFPFSVPLEEPMSDDMPGPKGQNLMAYDFEKDMLAQNKALRRYAMLLTKQPSTADDLMQDTFLRAWANRDKFIPGSSMISWLAVIMRNHFLTKLRKKNHETYGGDDFWAVVDNDNTSNTPMHDERLDLERALQGMPPDKLDIVLTIDVLGNDYASVARQGAVAEGTVKSRVFRSREYMQALLGEAYLPRGHKLPNVRLAVTGRQARNGPAQKTICLISSSLQREDTRMNTHGIQIDPELTNGLPATVSHVATLADLHRDVFCAEFKTIMRECKLTQNDLRKALADAGMAMAIPSIHNLMNSKSKWTATRCKVFLDLVGMTAPQLMERMGLPDHHRPDAPAGNTVADGTPEPRHRGRTPPVAGGCYPAVDPHLTTT
ncbi:MAG: sigma-70 family RNA polymerase sigma factor [Alphaproteobacteria bacterium]|nr:MAG: sigma-70 family RNA polymerase sigma factor [Alphaproteobacteria bacterium]